MVDNFLLRFLFQSTCWSQHRIASNNMILVTVRLSGVVTMGYSWLITARCDYLVLAACRSQYGTGGGGGRLY